MVIPLAAGARSLNVVTAATLALGEGLRQIKLKNVKDKSEMHIAFTDGVLEMRCAYALRTDGMFSDGEIRRVLEAGL